MDIKTFPLNTSSHEISWDFKNIFSPKINSFTTSKSEISIAKAKSVKITLYS